MKKFLLEVLLLLPVSLPSGFGFGLVLTARPDPAASAPQLGCCYTPTGTIANVTRFECITVHEGIGWSAGDCPCEPLGCCTLPCGQKISGVTSTECACEYAGVLWIPGDCP